MDRSETKDILINGLMDNSVVAPAATVAFDGQPATPRGFGLEMVSADSPQRLEVETFVRARYREIHGADVRQFLPVLLVLRGPGGRIAGVAGYRDAASEALFLEHYLDQPAEQVLAAHFQRKVARHEIAEIGNFACASCRASKDLVACLMEFLDQRGYVWAMFTGTRLIRQIMQHMGIDAQELVPAQRSRLCNSVDDWGSYYECDPRVVAGLVPTSVATRPLRLRS